MDLQTSLQDDRRQQWAIGISCRVFRLRAWACRMNYAPCQIHCCCKLEKPMVLAWLFCPNEDTNNKQSTRYDREISAILPPFRADCNITFTLNSWCKPITHHRRSSELLKWGLHTSRPNKRKLGHRKSSGKTTGRSCKGLGSSLRSLSAHFDI